MESWPVGLQQLLNEDNFTVAIGDVTSRSDMDVGLAKVRARYTVGIDVYTTSINFDIDDYDTFTTFYKTLINNGVDPFTFDDPLTGTEGTFRFAEAPQIAPLGGRTFRVTMKWEKLP